MAKLYGWLLCHITGFMVIVWVKIKEGCPYTYSKDVVEEHSIARIHLVLSRMLVILSKFLWLLLIGKLENQPFVQFTGNVTRKFDLRLTFRFIFFPSQPYVSLSSNHKSQNLTASYTRPLWIMPSSLLSERCWLVNIAVMASKKVLIRTFTIFSQ